MGHTNDVNHCCHKDRAENCKPVRSKSFIVVGVFPAWLVKFGWHLGKIPSEATCGGVGHLCIEF